MVIAGRLCEKIDSPLVLNIKHIFDDLSRS